METNKEILKGIKNRSKLLHEFIGFDHKTGNWIFEFHHSVLTEIQTFLTMNGRKFYHPKSNNKDPRITNRLGFLNKKILIIKR